MFKKINLLLLSVILLSCSAHNISTSMPDSSSILDKMRLANSHLMKKWPDPTVDTVTNKRRPSNIWTRAAYYEGLMALYSIDPDPVYYNYAVKWSAGHEWDTAYKRPGNRNADDQACGQTYIELYQIDPQPERIEKIKANIDLMLEDERNDAWWWIDALQMAMPVFAKLGAVTRDNRYFEKMYQIYNYTKTQHGGNGLYNPEDKLWWRDKDFVPPKTTANGRDVYWSRGNGWVLAAMVRVLDVMPEDAPHREEYLTMFKNMAEALVPLQREDGFWNVSLQDPKDFGGKETSGTAFFVYGCAWGLNNGILTDTKYKTAVVKGWNAMVKDALHPNGFLGFVQGTGKQPSDGQPVTYDKKPDFEDYALGAFLLAGSEVYKFARSKN